MFKLIDYILLALERLWQHRLLMLWALMGLIAAATLALSLPLYVDAVNSTLLASRLPNPPYAFRFRYLGSWNGPINLTDAQAASAVVNEGFTAALGLPIQQRVTYISSGAWSIQRQDKRPLGAFKLGTLEGAAPQMQIIAGEWPPQQPPAEGDPIPVLLSEKMLYEKGVQVGDILTVTPPRSKPLRVHVVALWRPNSAEDPTWIFVPKFFDEVLLTQREMLFHMMDGLTKPIEEAAWFTIFDGSALKTADVAPLLAHISDGQREIEAVLAGIRLDVSPMDGLNAFNQEVAALTRQLVIMILPVGGLVLYFVSLVAGLLVARQQNEDVTLRSRGMSRGAILTVHALQWLFLAGLSLGISLLLAPYVVQLVGQTVSFLRVDVSRPPLTVVLTPQALLAGTLTSLLAASSGLLIAWRTTRQTIMSLSQRSARNTQTWWQRFSLDIMLLVPAAYVYYTMSRGGKVVASAEDPFNDPLVFMGPTLFSLGLTLLFLRLLPMILRLAAWVVAQGRGISLLMALRDLTRSIGRYRGALLMMCFTLSLTGFTASMASTLDRSLVDSINYRIGADAVIVTVSDVVVETNSAGERTATGYNTKPAFDLLKLPEVKYVSRVGSYDARLMMGSRRIDAKLLGIDRGPLAAIVRWRQDFGDEPLANLLNRLGSNRTGVLISRKAAIDNNLKINQEITYQVQALGEWHEARVPIVGVIDFFPTLNPYTTVFMIGNIEPIWEVCGTEMPHDIWMSLQPNTDVTVLKQKVIELGYPVVRWYDPVTALAQAQASPARRGVLGFLSVGFVASIVLTLISNLIQITASFRSQSVQLGALRAMGLGSAAVGAYLILSQGLALLSGILGGTGIGVATTLLFLPLLDFSGGLPPYLIRVAWQDIIIVYGLFAGVLVFITVFSTIVLGRERLFTVVKLGEAA